MTVAPKRKLVKQILTMRNCACVPFDVVGLVRCRNSDILLARHWLWYTGDNGQL